MDNHRQSLHNRQSHKAPLEVTLVKRHKEWYRKWWGVILALLVLPFFVIWYAWAKSNWNKGVKVAVTVITVIAVLVWASANDNASKQSTPSDSQQTSNAQKADNTSTELAKIGTAVRDGKFEFTVNSIKCGITSVGQTYSTKTAQGQYCLLDITAKNIGNEAQTLNSGAQYLYNAQGQKFSADDSATYTATPSGNTWYNDINPGNSVTGAVVFDLPKDQTPVTAELHDSVLSNGIRVKLQ